MKVKEYFCKSNLSIFELFCICSLFTLVQNPTSAQINSDSTTYDSDKVLIISGISLAGMGLSYSLQDNIWWKGDKSKFHFNWTNDWETNLGADKFGHFYFTYLLTNIYSQAFDWAGVKGGNKYLFSGAAAMFHQTFTEVRDGFSKNYGFSWGDYVFNLVGTFYPYLQSHQSWLQNINFKISYEASKRFRQGSHSSIIDDYESTYNWVTININKFLPEHIEEYLPDFINLALGHSVTNLNTNPEHQIYLGLDWNLEGLPGEGSFLKLLKKNLNYYHLPAPAVMIYPKVVWYGLKW